MQLKEIIDSPCGLRFLFDNLDLQSGYARRMLLKEQMMKTHDAIEKSYQVLRRFLIEVQNEENATCIGTLQFKLRGLKDISSTISNLTSSQMLDDIELFEVKHLAILSSDVLELLRNTAFFNVIEIPDLEKVISILDPDGLRIATFYIYDSYSEELKNIRKKIKTNPEIEEELLSECAEIENKIRITLCKSLAPYSEKLSKALRALAFIDIYLAKAVQIQNLGLTIPEISENSKTELLNLFHPQVKAALEAQNKTFQPVDVVFSQQPTIITGANMGGKTVVLKALALCQYLFQFGFGIPSSSAMMDIMDEIYFCIGDDQSIEKGLSSFAAEMKNIDAVIQAAKRNVKILALIDEPARTTNPTEGTALVSSLIRMLSRKKVDLVMTTHYNISDSGSKRLRVKGFEEGTMNYALVEVQDGDAPHEALTIAETLGVDKEWISCARDIIKENLTDKSIS